MKTYLDAVEKLNGRTRRKLGNNTYLERRDEHSIAVRLHDTDILTYHDNGDCVYNSGGWQTPTTKDRMNEYGPVRITQDKRVWYAGFINGDWESYRTNCVLYRDGMTVNGDKITSAEIPCKSKDKEMNKVKREVNRYVNAYLDALEAGEVKAPGAGDCFYCVMREVDSKRPLGELNGNSDHIKSHMEENYFVPSLLARAIELFPVSIAARDWYLASYWAENAPEADRMNARQAGAGIGREQLSKALKRYIVRQLGFAS